MANLALDALGKMVIVVLKNGQSLRGRLRGFDQHLNLLLDEAEDVTKGEAVRKLGSTILRGDTIVYNPAKGRTFDEAAFHLL